MAPALQSSGTSLGGTSQVTSPSSPLNSILAERGPLGGIATAHTAPWLRSTSLHVKLSVCSQTEMTLSYRPPICSYATNQLVKVVLSYSTSHS